MTKLILILILTLISIVSCTSYVPLDIEYDTENLKKVKECEEQKKVPEEELSQWWEWKVPKNPTPCLVDCILKKFGWLSEDGSIDNSAIEKAYKDVGHSNPSIAACKLSKTGCANAEELFECLLNADGQKFKDAFDGRKDTSCATCSKN
uniref:D7-related salivary protein n=1 Tax=Culicoides nubeculosus TaxID=144565 RepID=B9URK7_CULNU|nr:D7-related salivary protein [Culicoides nubeculosus]